MTGFAGNSVWLTLVFGDRGVDAVNQVRSDGSFEDSREGDSCAVGGCRARSEDVNLRTGGLSILANLGKF